MALCRRSSTRFAPSPTGYLHLGHAFRRWTAGPGRGVREEGFCCVSRISTRRAAARITRRRCSKTCAGSASIGTGRSGANPTISPITRQPSPALQALGVIYPCFLQPQGHRRGPLRARMVPMARFIPAPAGRCPPTKLPTAQASGVPFALRLDVAKAAALCGTLTFSDERAGHVDGPARTAGRRRAGAARDALQLSSLRHRR